MTFFKNVTIKIFMVTIDVFSQTIFEKSKMDIFKNVQKSKGPLFWRCFFGWKYYPAYGTLIFPDGLCFSFLKSIFSFFFLSL